jgi:hypothetical protein
VKNNEIEIPAFDIMKLSVKQLSKQYGITEYNAKIIKEALETK